MNVLYVEDVPSDVDLTRRELSRSAPDIALEVVGSVAEALAMLDALQSALARGEDARFDLVLLDLSLPDGNGLDVLAEVRHRSLPLAVVVLTGMGDEQTVVGALRAGADDYLPKRNEYWTTVASTLRNALERFRSQAAFHARPLRLLYAEPNQHDAALTRLHLAAHAPFFRLSLVQTADEVLERLPGSGPVADVDVILLDYHLPGMNALEALKEILQERALDVPVILTTGHGTEDVALEALKLGAADYIVKSPGYLNHLPAAVENAFHRILAARERAALLESEAKYRQLIEQASDGIFVCDRAGCVLLANSRWCELLGYEQAEIIGMNSGQTYLDEEKELYYSRLEQARTGQTLRYERTVRRKDGSTFPAEFSLKMLESGMVQVITRDITERRSQERKIARLSRIHEVLSGINSAIVRIRDRRELFHEACRIIVEHGRFTLGWIGVLDYARGKLVAVAHAGLSDNPDAVGSELFNGDVGLAPAGVAKVALDERRSAVDNVIEAVPDAGDQPDTLKVRRAAIELGAKSVIVLPLFVDRQTFGTLTLYAPERDFFDDEELKLLGELAGDISFGLEFIAKEERVDYLAYYDALTGLPNRSLFFDRLTHQLAAAAREGSSVALVLMDLDRFRFVNDSLGRQAGDALINTVAQRIKGTFRAQDTVARVGADSFAVAVSGTWQTLDAGRALEGHNRRLFGQPFVVGSEELRVSATAGIAVFPGDGDHPEVLFANAEAALRKAKEQNARFLFYGPEMNARIADSLRLENRLRLALENGEMALWYQPKLSVKTRKLTGFEALMRWQDPETGLVAPGMFIPLMEQTGLILEAGRWALSQVARDCGKWSALGVGPPRIAVNVSPIQLREKDFVDVVTEAARNTQAVGASLDLEITENVFMDNVETIIPILQTVRALGVEIAVDDFGTGYSSLAYIARLPIHALKIDRMFVEGMTQNEDSLALVRSIISLAHSLRLHVVAEGVETEEQATLLRGLNCDQLQGFLLSRPVPPSEVPGLIRKLA